MGRRGEGAMLHGRGRTLLHALQPAQVGLYQDYGVG